MIGSKRELAEMAVGTGETWIGQRPGHELTIHTRHWHQLAMKNGGPAVWDAISKGMKAEAERFLAGVEGP